MFFFTKSVFFSAQLVSAQRLSALFLLRNFFQLLIQVPNVLVGIFAYNFCFIKKGPAESDTIGLIDTAGCWMYTFVLCNAQFF